MFLVHWDRQEVHGEALRPRLAVSSWTFLNALKGRVSCVARRHPPQPDHIERLQERRSSGRDVKMAVGFSSSVVREQKYFPSFY